MKYIPTLFSGPMVVANLEGRKTCTRRTRGLKYINESPGEWTVEPTSEVDVWLFTNQKTGERKSIRNPFGVIGDFLWVRETWFGNPDDIIYRADYDMQIIKWKSPYHMFRWASRTNLKRTSNRGPERVQEITPEDAISEGVMGRPLSEYSTQRGIGVTPDQTIAKTIFSELWNSIHGPDAWDRNEWVWPVEYEVVK